MFSARGIELKQAEAPEPFKVKYTCMDVRRPRVYLDHSATTYVREEVLHAMMPYFADFYGNPSSLHAHGREARRAIDDAREKVAEVLGVRADEIVFTGGGSEADNLAIKGTAWALEHKGRHIITSAIEHHAVLNTCKWLEKQGFEVTYAPVDSNGLVDLEFLESAIRDDTILITVMTANNEVGTIQDISAIAEMAEKHGIRFHTDAVQASAYVDLNLKDVPVCMASFSAHKFYGPKGVGMLFVRKGVKIESLVHGGSQEWGLRAGTENVAGIVGMAEALRLAQAEKDNECRRLAQLRDRLINGVLKRIEDVKLNGHPSKRLPNNANIAFKGADAQGIILQLDLKGISVSSGSACASGSIEPSHVLIAMGLSEELIRGSIRFTLGLLTQEDEIDYVLEVLPEVIEKVRQAGSSG